MANYNLVVNSTFTPFTYELYLAPFKEYKEAYETTEKAYSGLLTSAGAYEDIVLNSPGAKSMYENYYRDLQLLADSLSKGLNVNNRRALMGLKARFAKEITPIDRAYKEVLAANELRAKAGPDAIYQSNVYNIDDALQGKQLNNTYQSKSALTKKTATMIQSAILQRLQDPEFSKKFNDMYIAITLHTGGSYEDLLNALRLTLDSDPITNNLFSEIKGLVASDAGYNEHDNIGKLLIEAAINEGLYYGLDNPKVSLQLNPDWMSNLQKLELNLKWANYKLEKDALDIKKAAISSTGSSSTSEKTTRQRAPKIVLYNTSNTDRFGEVKELEAIPENAKAVTAEWLQNNRKEFLDLMLDKYGVEEAADGYDYYITETDAPGWFTGDDEAIVAVPRDPKTGLSDSYSVNSANATPKLKTSSNSN